MAIISRLSTSANAVYYPLEDNQGSGSHLTNSSGTSVARQSYAAFGLPRDGGDWDGTVPSGDQAAINTVSRRGYTGHSMLGSMGLIHMNGRVQDALTGRFLSPDPNIPNPGFTQSYNRYAYVVNNPLSQIDPTGFLNAFLQEICSSGSNPWAPEMGINAVMEMCFRSMSFTEASENGWLVKMALHQADMSGCLYYGIGSCEEQEAYRQQAYRESGQQVAVTGQSSSNSGKSAGTTVKPGNGKFVNVGKYTTNFEIVKWTVAFLNSIPQQNDHLENTFSLRINKDGHWTFTENVVQGDWDELTGKVTGAIGLYADTFAIVHDHGKGQSIFGIGPDDREATRTRGLVSFIQTKDLDVVMVEPTRQNRNGTYRYREVTVWRPD